MATVNLRATGSTTTMTMSGTNPGTSFGQILLAGDGNLLPSGLPPRLRGLSNWNGNADFEFTSNSKSYQGVVISIAACGAPITPASPQPSITSGVSFPFSAHRGACNPGSGSLFTETISQRKPQHGAAIFPHLWAAHQSRLTASRLASGS